MLTRHDCDFELFLWHFHQVFSKKTRKTVVSYYSPASVVVAHKGKLSRRGLPIWRGSSLQGLDGTLKGRMTDGKDQLIEVGKEIVGKLGYLSEKLTGYGKVPRRICRLETTA